MPRPPRGRQYQRGPHLYQRAGVWYAYTPAAPKGTSLRTRDRGEAERAFGELLARGPEAVAPRGRAGLTLAELAATWIAAPHGYTRRTIECHTERVASVLRWLVAHGASTPAEVTPELVDAWVADRSTTVSRRTINRDLRTLKVCLRWCAGRELCTLPRAVERPPLREAKRTTRRVVPSPEELKAILEHVRADLRPAFAVLVGVGLRHEELRRLSVGDLHDGAVWVRPELGPAATAEPTKGYRERKIPVADAVAEQVKAFLAWKADPKRGHLAHKNQLHRALKLACDAAGVPRCGLHDLRRAFATEAVRNGVPLTVVSRWLGHRLTSTTEAYIAEYRSDGERVAPVPLALSAGADSLQKAAVHSGPNESPVQRNTRSGHRR